MSRGRKKRRNPLGAQNRQTRQKRQEIKERHEERQEEDALKTAESRLYSKAVKNGWDIPPEVKKLMTKQLVNTLSSHAASVREKTAANKVLVTMNGQNIDLEKMEKATPSVVVNTNANAPETARQIAEELMKNEEFLDYRRSTLQTPNPSDVCDSGE